MIKIRFYLSHSIRGKHGENATPVQIKKNCNRILDVASMIRLELPSIDLYVPAEHEDFVYLAYKNGYLTEQQVLAIDCKIIDTCDGVLVYSPADDPIQGGRMIEFEHAQATNKPVWVFEYIDKAIDWLTQQIMRA